MPPYGKSKAVHPVTRFSNKESGSGESRLDGIGGQGIDTKSAVGGSTRIKF